MFTRFAAPARRVVVAAVAQAELRGDARVGTEHLLLGLLVDPTSPEALALGITLTDTCATLDAMDRAALASVGVVVDELPPYVPSRPGAQVRMTAAAKETLQRSLRSAVLDKSRHIEARHLLEALLECLPPDPVGDLLAAMSVDPGTVRARLRDAA